MPGQLNGSQALDIRQAVAAFTRNPAAAMGLQDTAGMLRPGLSADFIVLDRNIFAGAPAEIHATTVLQTYFEGRLVHQSPGQPGAARR